LAAANFSINGAVGQAVSIFANNNASSLSLNGNTSPNGFDLLAQALTTPSTMQGAVTLSGSLSIQGTFLNPPTLAVGGFQIQYASGAPSFAYLNIDASPNIALSSTGDVLFPATVVSTTLSATTGNITTINSTTGSITNLTSTTVTLPSVFPGSALAVNASRQIVQVANTGTAGSNNVLNDAPTLSGNVNFTGSIKRIQSGTTGVSSGGTVTFNTPFAAVPSVVAVANQPGVGSGSWITILTRTTTNFSWVTIGTGIGINWIATDFT
jgi:hypothetical protein